MKTQRKPRPSRAFKDSPYTSYNLVKAPRELLQKAQAKCAKEDPPSTLKATLIRLLSEWVQWDPIPAKQIPHKADPPVQIPKPQNLDEIPLF